MKRVAAMSVRLQEVVGKTPHRSIGSGPAISAPATEDHQIVGFTDGEVVTLGSSGSSAVAGVDHSKVERMRLGAEASVRSNFGDRKVPLPAPVTGRFPSSHS
ncbi:hypothetical protein GCM10020366_13930 [Saccharopolyspora gregorii]|uniref:Uncharacterized protein n=1 Tax=Saccharopolyspora gregorii TaxID=33914 RepID=A0ABP6RK87_9PSEU